MMPETIRVSAVIPCYNGERLVRDAVESVHAQTTPVDELIVVDDASTDSSPEILRELEGAGKLRVITHETNKGIAAARNTGIKAATGEWLAFLDHDDLWKPLHVERLCRVASLGASDEQLAIVFSQVEFLRESEQGILPNTSVPHNFNDMSGGEIIRALFFDNFIVLGASLVRARSFEEVGMLDESIRSGSDDFEFFIRLAKSHRFHYVHEPLLVRRFHADNYTDVQAMIPTALGLLDRASAEVPELAKDKHRVKSLYLYNLGRDLHLKGRRVEARRAYGKSLRANPGNAKPWVAWVLCRLGPLGDRIWRLRSATKRKTS